MLGNYGVMRHRGSAGLALTLQLLLVKGLHGVPRRATGDTNDEVKSQSLHLSEQDPADEGLQKVSLSSTGDVEQLSPNALGKQAYLRDEKKMDRGREYTKLLSLLQGGKLSVDVQADGDSTLTTPTDLQVKAMTAVREGCSHRRAAAILAEMGNPSAAATLPDHGNGDIDDPCAELQKKTTAAILAHHIVTKDPRTGETVQIPVDDPMKSKEEVHGDQDLDERASFWWWWSLVVSVVMCLASCVLCGICATRFQAEKKAKKFIKKRKEEEFKQEYDEAVQRIEKIRQSAVPGAAASGARASATGSRTLPPQPGPPPAKFDTLPPQPGPPPAKFDKPDTPQQAQRSDPGETVKSDEPERKSSSEPDF
jgi:hypothetical protein